MGISGALRCRGSPLSALPCLSPVLVSGSYLRRGTEVEVQMKNQLRVLRAQRGWSQADLADQLDVSRQSVNAIETGKYDPSLPLAFKLAKLFETAIEEIFQDEA